MISRNYLHAGVLLSAIYSFGTDMCVHVLTGTIAPDCYVIIAQTISIIDKSSDALSIYTYMQTKPPGLQKRIKALISASVNYQLSTCINDRKGSMHIENGYYNKDYSFLGKYLFERAIVLLVMTYW